jgi:thiol:disulfide interchange protein DsbC
MREGVEAKPAAADCSDPIGEIAKLAAGFGIQGTPGLVFANGKLIPGLIEAEQIEVLLATMTN